MIQPIDSLTVGDDNVCVSESARNIGVIFDSHVSMESHINQVSRLCYFQLRNLSSLRPFLDTQSLEKVVHCFISTRLDYCNSLFVGLPDKLLYKLQKIQNAAARILTGSRKRDHITPVLKKLHWLPVCFRVQYKCLVMVFKCIHSLAHAYLCDLINVHRPSRTLRSADNQCDLVVPFSRSAMANERAFSIAGPRLWNALPDYLKCHTVLDDFKQDLKTFLFCLAF